MGELLLLVCTLGLLFRSCDRPEAPKTGKNQPHPAHHMLPNPSSVQWGGTRFMSVHWILQPSYVGSLVNETPPTLDRWSVRVALAVLVAPATSSQYLVLCYVQSCW